MQSIGFRSVQHLKASGKSSSCLSCGVEGLGGPFMTSKAAAHQNALRPSGRLDDVDLDVAVFTNVSEEHLSDRGGTAAAETVQEHTALMASMFSRLTDPDRQRAVVNVDGAESPGRSAVPQLRSSVLHPQTWWHTEDACGCEQGGRTRLGHVGPLWRYNMTSLNPTG